MAPQLGYLELGSNVGDRLEHLFNAVAALPEHGVSVESSSSVYETEPVGDVLDQRDFYNACLRVRTELGPEELLDASKEVERVVGREPAGVRHGPRVIDVDVLMLGELKFSSPRLTLPHPSITGRRFVLVPLLELEPELTLPCGPRLADVLQGLGEGQAVRRVNAPLV